MPSELTALLALAYLIAMVIAPLAFLHLLFRDVSKSAAGDLSFEDVCRAVARVKNNRSQDEPLSRDFVDGADAVMGELMDECDASPEEMQTAIQAGGEEVTLDP